MQFFNLLDPWPGDLPLVTVWKGVCMSAVHFYQ